MGRKIQKAIGIILLFLLTSCYIEQAVENYKGSIVIDKYKDSNIVKIKKLVRGSRNDFYSIHKIKLTTYDYKKYNIGDTIK